MWFRRPEASLREADEYHKKLIEQHNEFLEAKKADEARDASALESSLQDLLRWQSEHRCTPWVPKDLKVGLSLRQHVAVNFVGPGEHDSNGDPSGDDLSL